ncbi:hypothetical protein SCLCIDRAFT_80969, partial [Scleroderma citrinum Foug A]
VLFKANRFYAHSLLRTNYTTYDLHRETDTVNPCTDHCDIMLLAQNDGESTISHPFCYAHGLGIYHANVVFIGPESRDYQSRHLKFLWVQWFKLLNTPAGWEQCFLNKGRFIPMHQTDTFGFVDPMDVLWCCHLILAFTDGQQHLDSISMSFNTHDADDWKYYYINRYFRFADRDIVMCYHWSLGIGHTY